MSDFSENVVCEVKRASALPRGCQSRRTRNVDGELLDNGNRRLKWKIFEDRDASMPERRRLSVSASLASPDCDPNLGTRLTHFRCQPRAISFSRGLYRADRSMFVRGFARDENMTKWFHLAKFLSSRRKCRSRIFAVNYRGRLCAT